MANCSNPVSFVLTSVFVKVGTDLTRASGLLRNMYAHVDESVNVVVRVESGNGYSIVANFDDSNAMMLPWTYLSSSGTAGNGAVLGYVAPKATFGVDGITIIYAYKTPGKYQVNKTFYFNFCIFKSF